MKMAELKDLNIEDYVQREVELCPQCKGVGSYLKTETGFPLDEKRKVECEICESSGRVLKEHIELTCYSPYKK